MRALSIWVIASHLFGLVPAVFAGPEGGVVVGGAASIDQSAGLTTIRQSTDRAIINWGGFSSSASERINFQQPGVNSATVNRVTGGGHSQLDGALDANGHVFILNPNGVVFGKSARVNVGGLTATTLDMDNGQFMSGSKTLTLRQRTDKVQGAVVNQGSIVAGKGGVTLIAPVVNNEGSIRATGGGNVNIGAGTEAELEIGDTGLMSMKVRGDAGGDVHLPDGASSDVLETVVNQKNFVEAGSVRKVNGEVILGGAGGVAVNEGTISAEGATNVRAGKVLMDSTQASVLAPFSKISANGSGLNSDGGEIKVLSRGNTVFATFAEMEARGGTTGNGGLVETSADRNIFVDGDVDTSAPGGEGGRWIIDPSEITIVSGASGTGAQDGGSFTGGMNGATGILANVANNGVNTLSDGRINAQMVGAGQTDVFVEATGHINFNNGVSIQLANNHNIYFHVTNTTTDANAQIFGPSSGLAQISNLQPDGTGKVLFLVNSGTNSGRIDLSNMAIDGAAGGVFVITPGSVTVDRISANGATGIVNIQAGGRIDRTLAVGNAQNISGSQVLMKANGIGTNAIPVVVSTPQLIVDQSLGGDVFLSSSGIFNAANLASTRAANITGSGSYSLATANGSNIVVGQNMTVADTAFATFGNLMVTGVSNVTGLTNATGTLKLNSAGNITTEGAAIMTAQTGDLTAVTGITSANTQQFSTLSAKNMGPGVVNDINLINGRAVTFSARNEASTNNVVFRNTTGGITVGAGNVFSVNDVTVTADAGDITFTGTTTGGAAKTVNYTATTGAINGSGLLTAGTVLLTAPNGIGNTTQVFTASPNVALRSTLGNINVGSQSGNVKFAALAGNGSVNLQAIGGLLESAVVDGLTGVTSSTAGKTISLANTSGGDVKVTSAVTSNAGNIAIVSSMGVQLANDVTTGSNANGFFIDVIAQNGTITRTAGSLTSGTVAMDATGGIGTTGQRVQTSTSNLQLGGLSVGGTLVVNGGDDFITNSNAALILAGVSSGNVDVINNANALTVGTLTAGAFAAPLPSGFQVTSSAQNGLTVNGGRNIALTTVTSGNVAINNAVTASAGAIGIVAADGIVLAADVSTVLNNNGKTTALVARNGSITRTAGTVTSGNVALAATGGIGASGQRVQTSTSNLQLGGLSVNGTAVTNSGDDFIENTGNVAMTVAGGTPAGTGSVDIVQNNANITTGNFAAGTFNFAPNLITSAQRTGVTVAGAASQIALATIGAGDIIVTDNITTAGGNIGLVSIANIAQAGNISTGSNTGASIADLIARGGTITRTGGTVRAGNVLLAATGGIGSATSRIETITSNLQVGGAIVNSVGVTNGGDDFINNSGGNLTFAAINATGSVDLTQTNANLTVGSFAADAFNFAPAGGSPANMVNSSATAGVTLLGNAKTISLVTVGVGDITVSSNVTAKNGDIGIVAADNIVLAADVASDTTGAALNTKVVDLIARNGTITRTAGTVTSGNVAVSATGGIGAATAGNRLQTSTSNLQLGGLTVNGAATTNGGNDFIENVNSVALTVAGNNANGNVDITQTGANMTVGSANIGAFSPAGASSAAIVTVAPQTGLTLNGSTRTLSLVTQTSGNIVVNQGISTNGGNIGIISADAVSLAANVSTNSSINSTLVDVIARNGSISRTAGAITAGNVALSATAGIGAPTANNRIQTRTSRLQVGGLTVNGSAQTNTGSVFVENVGGFALTVAGNTTAGDLDITQTDADMTVGTLNLGAFDPANPDSAAVVTGTSQVGLTTITAGRTIALLTLSTAPTSPASINVNNDVTTNAGNIGIIAATDINLGANVTTGATSGGTLADLVAQAGVINRSAGTVTAGNVAAAAAIGIGLASPGQRLRTSTSNLQLGGLFLNGSAQLNGGDDFVENVGGVALKFAAFNSNGVIDLTQTGANLTVSTSQLGLFDPANPNSAAVVTAPAATVGITALGSTKTISLLTLGSGDIIVDTDGPISSNAGSIGIISANNVSFAQDVTTGSSTNLAQVDVIAMAGSITHTAGTITAGNVAVAATAGIGAPTTNNRLRTATSNLQIGGLSVGLNGGGQTAVVNAGNDYVENTGANALKFAAVNANGNVDVTNDGANLTVDQLQLGAFDPATPVSAAKVTSVLQNGVNLAGAASSLSLVTQGSGDIVVTRNINTTNGNVGLVSAKSIVIGNNVSTSSATNNALVDLVARDGSITRSNTQILQPTVTSGTVVAAATQGMGAALANSRLRTSTSNLQLGGVSVNGTAVVNAGDDFLENIGSIAMKLSAVNANGNTDVTQTGADVTISTQQAGAFDPANPNSAAVVTAPAATVGISSATAGKTVAITTLTAGNIVVAADGPISTNAGDIGLVSANGISLAADVTNGSATNTSLVDLIARSGAITRSGGTVTSGNVAVAATQGIGSATARLVTSTSNLQVGNLTTTLGGVTNAGNDFIENTGGIALTFAGINATHNIDLVQNNANLTIGSLRIGDFDPAAPNSAVKVTSATQDGVAVQTIDRTLSLITVGTGDIIVNNRIATNSGDTALISAKSVQLANDINLTSAGALLDVIAQDGSITRSAGTLTSENLVLAATAGIGTSTARVETSVSHLKLGDVSVNGTPVVNAGSDFIRNVGGVAMTVAGFNNTGSVDITQDAASMTIGTEAIGAFDPASPNSFGVVTATSRAGLVLAGTDQTLSLVTLTSGNIVVNNDIDAGPGGDAALVSVQGVNLNASITATDLVDVVARGGFISRSAGVITANNVALAATQGIGTATARVRTTTPNLQLGGLSVNGSAVVNGGNDFVANGTGQALTVAGVTNNGNIDVTNDGANMTVGTLQLGAFDPVNPNSAAAVSAAAPVVGVNTLTAGKTISLVTLNSGDIIVELAGPITSNAGDIALVSASGIQLRGDVTTGSNNNAGTVDLIARNGSISRIGGVVTADKVAAAATAGIGLAGFGFRLRTSTHNLQLGGLTVNGTPVTNAGNDFVENITGVAMNVAGINANGNIDITTTNANLSVGQLTLGAFDPAAPDSAVVVTTAQQTGLTAQGAGSTISLVSLTGGDVKVNQAVTSNNGAIGLIGANNVTLGANVTNGSNANAAPVNVVARGGSITHTAGTITSQNVQVAATAGIGAAAGAGRVQTDTQNLKIGGISVDGVAFVNGGDDFLANSGGPVTVAGVNASGNIDVTQTGANLTVGSLNIADFAPAAGNSAASITGANVDGLTTAASGKSISLVTQTSGNIVVNQDVTVNAGTAALVSAGGVVLANDVTAGSAFSGTVDVIARGGAITRTSGLLTANNVALDAVSGIGAAGARVRTSTSNLQIGGLTVNDVAVVNGGDDFVSNVGGAPLNVAGVNASGAIDVVQDGADLTVSSLNVGAFSPAGANSAARIVSTAQVGLRTQGSGQTIALTTVNAGDVVVDDMLATSGGNLGVLAANGIRIQDEITTGAMSGASTVDLIAQNGGISRTAGTVMAGGVAVSASGGIGTSGSRLVLATSGLQVGGLAVNGVAATSAGDTFFSNFGAPLTVAGTNNGGVDVVQNGNALLVGTLGLGAFSPQLVTSATQVGLTSILGGGIISLMTVGSGDVNFQTTATAATGSVRVNSAGGIVNLTPGQSNLTAIDAQLTAATDIGASAAFGVTAQFLTANAPNGLVNINSFNTPNTRITGNARTNFTMTQLAGDLLIDAITAGDAVTLTATAGSILNGSTGGGQPNISTTNGARSTLTASGTVGTRETPITVNLSTGTLGVRAGGEDGAGASANIDGTITPEFTINQLGTFTGDVIFNGRVLSGTETQTESELDTARTNPAQTPTVNNPVIATVQLTVAPDAFQASTSAIITADPYNQDDFVEEDGGTTSQSRRVNTERAGRPIRTNRDLIETNAAFDREGSEETSEVDAARDGSATSDDEDEEARKRRAAAREEGTDEGQTE